MPLLASLSFALPAQAALPPYLIAEATAIPSANTTSFYQKQRDKLQYTPDATPLSLDFPFLQKESLSPKTQQNDLHSSGSEASETPPTAAPAQSRREQNQERKRQRKPLRSTPSSIGQAVTQKQTKENPSQRNANSLNEYIGKQQSGKKHTQSHTQKQGNKLPQPKSKPFAGHRDPYAILEAARKKHSLLQGNHLSIGLFKQNKISFQKPNLEPLKQQIPQKINQLKSDLEANIQQQPEQVKRAIATATSDLQQRSAEKISGPMDNLNAFIRRTIKEPLSNLLRKIGTSAQEAAERLQ